MHDAPAALLPGITTGVSVTPRVTEGPTVTVYWVMFSSNSGCSSICARGAAGASEKTMRYATNNAARHCKRPPCPSFLIAADRGCYLLAAARPRRKMGVSCRRCCVAAG